MSRQCTISHDTVCKPCAIGYFSSEHNLSEECSKCSKCDPGEYVLKQCTKSSDTVCAPCPDITDVLSNHLDKECIRVQDQQGDDAKAIIQDGNEDLQDGNVDDKVDSNNDKTVELLYESSGVEENIILQAVPSDTKAEPVVVVPAIEGSGETPEEETKENITYNILPDIDTNETESEGDKLGVWLTDSDKSENITEPGVDVIVSSYNTTTPRQIILGGVGPVLKTEHTPGNFDIT